MKSVKHYCLVLLTMFPMIAVSFAAQSALGVAQIRAQSAADSDSRGGGPLSIGSQNKGS